MKLPEKLLKLKRASSLEDFKRNYMIENAMTNSEKQVWMMLQKQKADKLFKRQYTFKYFIIDFYSEELKISIEIDSKTRYHNKDVDAIKKQLLDDAGVKNIIIQKDDLKNDEKKVFEMLKKEIGGRGK